MILTGREDEGGSVGLAALVSEIARCRICRDSPAGGLVKALPHEPRPVCVASDRAPILIAGQAPGTRVHASGRPFTDPSGERLRDWLGVDAGQFYDVDNFAIVPMGFCFPGLDAKGGDLPPRRECADAWREKLMAHMPQVRLVLAIGAYAQAWHFARAVQVAHLRQKTLTDTVRNWRAILEASSGTDCVILPLPHPSWRNSGWLKKNPWFEAELLPELKDRVARLISA